MITSNGSGHPFSMPSNQSVDTFSASAMIGIYGSAVAAALVLIVAKYLFNFEIFAYITAAFPALGLASVHSEISKELGEPLINFLTPEQKKDCLSSIAFATVIVIALGLFGVPLLNSWLGD